MLVTRLEFGGIASVHDANGVLLWRSAGFACLYRSPADHAASSSLREALREVVVDVGSVPIECVLVVPHSARDAGVAELCSLLESERIRSIGVVGALRASAIDSGDDRSILVQRGMSLGAVSVDGDFEVIVGLNEAFGMLYADIRNTARNELSKDIVRMNLSLEQVVGAAFMALVDRHSDTIPIQTGRNGVAVTMPRIIFDAPLHRFSRSLRDACRSVVDNGVIIGDDTLAELLRLGEGNPTQWLEVDVLDGERVSRAIAGFLDKAKGVIATPFYIDSLLDFELNPEADETPDKGTVTPPWRSALVTALTIGICVASAWAAVATTIAISQQSELRAIRNSVAGVATETATNGSIVRGTANEARVDATAEHERASVESNRTMRAPTAAHLDAKTTKAGYSVVYIAPGGGQGFWIGRHELTNEEYQAFLAAMNRVSSARGASNLPIDGLKLDDVLAFFEWASRADPSANYRLPTLEEWRAACLASGDGPLGAGVNALSVPTSSNFVPSSEPSTATVANDWGLHGFNGNVAEWVSSGTLGGYGLAGGSYKEVLEDCGCYSINAVGRDSPSTGGIRIIAEFVR